MRSGIFLAMSNVISNTDCDRGEPRILLRPAFNEHTGYGHCGRIAAIRELFLDSKLDIKIVVNEVDQSAMREFFGADAEMLVIPASASSSEAQWLRDQTRQTDILVLDGYCFDQSYQTEIRSAHPRSLLVFDDLVQRLFDCDYVINAAGYSTLSQPSINNGRALTGPKFAVVRKAFIAREVADEAKKSQRASGKTLFVSFGTLDSAGIALDIISQSAIAANFEKIHIVSSKLSPSFEEISRLSMRAAAVGVPNIILHAGAGADEIALAMAESSVAIVSSSTIGYEAAVVGIPIVTGYWIENQQSIYQALVDLNLAYGVGDLKNVQKIDWAAAISQAKSIFERGQADGKGSNMMAFGAEPGATLKNLLLSELRQTC